MKPATRFATITRLFGAAALLVIASGATQAQTSPLTRPTFSLKAGAFFPTSGTLKSESASPYYVVGVEADPNFRYRFAGGRIAFTAEAFYRENGKTRFLTIPLVARITWDITKSEERRIYGGLGAGIYFIETKNEGTTLQPGARFIVGVDLNERWFLETNYDYISGFTDSVGKGIKPGGLSLQVGYRY